MGEKDESSVKLLVDAEAEKTVLQESMHRMSMELQVRMCVLFHLFAFAGVLNICFCSLTSLHCITFIRSSLLMFIFYHVFVLNLQLKYGIPYLFLITII